MIINSLLINGLLALVLAAGIYLMFRTVARPFRDILSSLDKLERGDTAISLSGLGRTDEIGRMSESVLRFRDAIVDRRLAEDIVAAPAKRPKDSAGASPRCVVACRRPHTR